MALLKSIMLENAVVNHVTVKTDTTIIGPSYFGLTYWIDKESGYKRKYPIRRG